MQRLARQVKLSPEVDPAQPGWIQRPIGEELTKKHGLYLFKTREE